MRLRLIHSFRHTKKRWLFLGPLLLTIVTMLAVFYSGSAAYAHRRPPRPKLIDEQVYFSSQLYPAQMHWMGAWKIKTLVDLRPDGEAARQPSSSEMRSAASAVVIDFHYIPVPHEDIPDEDVAELDKVLTSKALPACLYCRTGRRAVRLYALVLASRANGPNADTILQMVKSAGFSADDLQDEIAQRIARRNSDAVITRP